MKIEKPKVSLAYSTCPNDTFIFNAIHNRLIDLCGIEFETELHDVEELNRRAARGIYDVSKLSFAAVAHLKGKYSMLASGAALGNGCGPLIVARERDLHAEDLGDEPIAVPGHWTTACMLASLYLGGDIKPVAMRFDEIMPAVQSGRFRFGVIIHEGRFTYKNYGLTSILDLGQWWEETTGLPIPLGVIAVRSDMPEELYLAIERIIRKSVVHARQNPTAADSYVRKYAAEMEPEVIRRHIELYVNEFTEDIGETGRHAVEKLFEMAVRAKIIKKIPRPLFATQSGC